MMPRNKCFPDCWPDDQAGHVRASNDGDQQWMKEAMRIKSQALPGTIRNNMWENTGQTGLTSQLCYCYGEESFETEKMLNLIYSYGYFLSSRVFLSVWQWQSFTSLLLFLSAIIKSLGMWRRKSSKDSLKNALGQALWQFCFLVTMQRQRYGRDKPWKYDPSHEVFMSEYTSDCHIPTLISSGQHSTHFSSLPKNILTSAKKTSPDKSRTGSQLRRWRGGE